MPPLASLWQMKLQNDSHKRSQNIHGIGCNFGNRSCVDRNAVHLALADYQISGKEKATPAMFMPLDIKEKENKYIVGIDRLTRYNVRVVIGEFVTISKTNGIAADKITKNR